MPRAPGQQQGRQRINGSGRAPKVFQRVAYSYKFKLKVVDFYLASHSMDATVRKFFSSLSSDHQRTKKRRVYEWVKQREFIAAKCTTGKGTHCNHRSLGMATILPVEAEEQLVHWINSLRSEGVPVTGRMVRVKAKDFYQATDAFMGVCGASPTWLVSFLRRHRLAIRRRTHEGQKTPHDAEEKATEFGREVQQRMQELGIRKVYNADQTAINYEYLPSQTVATKGSRTVWMKSAGKGKERVTAMLLGDSDGNKYDPFLVFKTKPSNDAKRAWQNTAFQHGFGIKLWKELVPAQTRVQIYGNRAGWWNSELTIQFLIHHFLHRENMHEPILLLLDDFSGHWREDACIFARLVNVELMKVPAGYTFACQPADISWNKPIKDRLRTNWGKQILQQLRTYRPGTDFVLKAPSRHQLITWTKDAWAALPTTAIINGFVKAKIIDSLVNLPPLIAARDSDADPEPEWEEIFQRVQDYNVRQQAHQRCAVVDPAKDIERLSAYDCGGGVEKAPDSELDSAFDSSGEESE